MVELLHEVWRDPERNAVMCWIASNDADKHRSLLHPSAVLVRTFRATSYDDAMRQHHEAEGWGEYIGMTGITDQPYTEEQAKAQIAYLNQRDPYSE